MVERIRTRRGSALVLRGESGIGKTALLDYVAERAAGHRVIRVTGARSERELAFAGVHQLCSPLLTRLERLPGPRKDALRIVFGQVEGAAPDRFVVGLAVLTLICEAAEDEPVLGVVDDAQWLDQESAQVLGFVARRLRGERVGLVAAVRGREESPELAGLPGLLIEGIADRDARSLLASLLPGRLDGRVRDRLIDEARGNPLALREFARAREPAELAGGFNVVSPRPSPDRLEQSFVRELTALDGGALSDEARLLILTAAADPSGEVPLFWRAAEQLGIGVDAAAQAVDSGLIEVGARLRFRHPLMRSAVYRAASAEDRRAAHRALAEAADPEVDPDRRAWHLARVALSPDEAVARELEDSAHRARERAGIAAAAAFLARASELSPDPAQRGDRALTAAEATLAAGAPDAALRLLANAQPDRLDDVQRARMDRVRARVALAANRGREALPLLLSAARRAEPSDAALARETYLEALFAAVFAGQVAHDRALSQIAHAARAACKVSGPSRPIDLLLDGLILRFTQGCARGGPALKRALEAFAQQEAPRHGVRWYGLACRTAVDLWDDQMWHRLAIEQVRLARDSGAISVLCVALIHRAALHVFTGEFASARALLDEADALGQVAGRSRLRSVSMMVAAWRGDEKETFELREAVVRDLAARGERRAIVFADYSSAVVDNALCRYEAAVAHAHRAVRHGDLSVGGCALVELVEAAVRSGQRQIAAEAMGQLIDRARVSGSDWALGLEACARALLNDGAGAERLYQEAIERLTRTRILVHSARARLLYGEWLRRQNRRTDAREPLQAAYEWFTSHGASAFAERARQELRAVGLAVRNRVVRVETTMTA
ncbi:MAG: ATP-binding protein, partial [Pseudonocardia sp.]|nr:ATP-binding protein [Pseudonocardia sp.]